MGNQRAQQTKTTQGERQRERAIANRPPFSTPSAVHPILQLQRRIGNQAVSHLIQAKLKVGQPGDVYEQEADRVADTVMRMPEPLVQQQPAQEEETAQAKPLVGQITPLVQRQAEEEKKEEPVQMLQRQAEEDKKEEPVQMLQRQAEEDKKEQPVQMLQRQAEEDKKEEPVQAKEVTDQTPEVTPDLEGRIQSMRGGGQPLPESTRTFFEPRFGYDFSGVRVHTDSQADNAARGLNAQAFTIGQDIFFGAGRYEPHTTQGRWLMAHELTHTVQQQPKSLPTVQSSSTSVARAFSQGLHRQPIAENEEKEPIQTKEIGEASEALTGHSPARMNPHRSTLVTSETSSFSQQGQENISIQRQSLAIRSVLPQIQRFGLDDALDWVAERAGYIPGFTLLTFILGRNPINNRPVERNATNLLGGLLGLIPGIGPVLFRGLQASGALDRAFSWLNQELRQLNITWDAIRELFSRAWDAISVTDLLRPSAAFERIRNIFNPTIERIRAFASTVVSRIFAFIKESILRPVGQFAQRLPGYPLLSVLLGKDPITDEVVDRNATNVIRGILLIIPGGEQVFQNLQQSGVIERAFAWFNEQIIRLNLTWNAIKALFARAWDGLSANDILSPGAAFDRIRNIFAEPVQRIGTFAGNAIRKVAEFIFEGVLSLAGGFGQQVLGIFRRASSIFSTIINNPIGFVGNLVGAVRRGFQQFSNNILTHLRTGLIGWLFGALSGAGLQLPERFDLRGIVSIVMQVLGLTYARLRTILVRLIGAERVSRVEQVFDFLVTIAREGLAAAWERIVEFAGNLQEMVIGGIRDWVARTVIGQAIARLVTLFNPAGAVIQSIMAIYNTVVFFIERAQQIGALAEAVFESIANIAAGNISAAASYVERTMARTIPVVISFLARLIGLGNVSEQIQNIIRRIQAPIENAMNRLANFIVNRVRGLLSRGREQTQTGVTRRDTDEPVSIGGESHTLRVHVENGRIRILMASNSFDDIAIQIERLRALYTDRFSQRRDPVRTQAISDRLTRVEQRGQRVSTEYANAPDEVARDQVLRNGLHNLKEMLSRIGEDFGLPGLHYERPTHNYVPQGVDSWGRAIAVVGDPISEASRGKGGSASVDPAGIYILSGYERGHLLAESLGGPGNNRANLAPMSSNTNRAATGMQRPEQVARNAIYNVTANPPNVLRYTVRCEYRSNSGLETWLTSHLGAAPGSADRLYTQAALNQLSNADIHNALGSIQQLPLTIVQTNRLFILRQLAYYFMPYTFRITIDVIQGSVVVPSSLPVPNHQGVTLP